MAGFSPFLILVIETISALTLITFVLGAVLDRLRHRRARQIAIGLLMGTACIVTQKFPVHLGEGVYVDSRAVILGTTAAFFSAPSAALALAMGILTRLSLGPVGAFSGVLSMSVACLVGITWRATLHQRFQESNSGLMILAGAVNLSLVPPFFFLPPDWRQAFYTMVGFPLVVTNLVGVMVFGMLIRREYALRRATKRLIEMASTDQLTGLLNRHALIHRINTDLIGKPCALLLIDVDHFKAINDGHGHDVGDAVLRQLAVRLRHQLPDGPFVARIGGEEFAVCVPDAGVDQALDLAEALRESCDDTTFLTNRRAVPVTISIGVSGSRGLTDFGELFRRADQALYRAKRAGRNRVVVDGDATATSEPATDDVASEEHFPSLMRFQA